jgi:cell division protein ZapA
MPQIQVMIAGRSYRMACADGEEAHLRQIAAAFEDKIVEMREAFGEIGDMRLHVMAALTFVDELAESQKRLAALERDVAALREATARGDERSQLLQTQMAEALTRTAERIERLARMLSIQPPAPAAG